MVGAFPDERGATLKLLQYNDFLVDRAPDSYVLLDRTASGLDRTGLSVLQIPKPFKPFVGGAIRTAPTVKLNGKVKPIWAG